MKKINHKIGLYVGLLSLTTFSSCLHTKQEMNKPTLGNAKRNCNRNQKKYIIGGVCAGLLATTGLGTCAFSPPDSALSSTPEGNGTNFTTTTPYVSFTTYHPSIPGGSSATESSSTSFTPMTPYELSTAYNSSMARVPDATKKSSGMGTTALMEIPYPEKCDDLKNNEDTGYIAYIKCLVRNKVDLNKEDKNNKNLTPLMYAAINNNIDLAQLLIENNVDMNKANTYRMTALMYAAKFDLTDMAKLLIDHKADVNVKSEFGRTALMIAAQYASIDMINLLIKYKADVHAKNAYGRNALTYAEMYNDKEIAESLRATSRSN